MGGEGPWRPKDVPGGCGAGRAATVWFLPQIVTPTAFPAGDGANPGETQHHAARTDRFDDRVAHLTGVVQKLQLLPPLTFRPFSSPARKKERQLLVAG